MDFKSRRWYWIAVVLSVLNLGGMWFALRQEEPRHAMVHALLTAGFGIWAWRLRRRTAAPDASGLEELVQQQAAALEDAQATLADQSSQIAELQERLDFNERILAQVRDRPSQGARDDTQRQG